MCIIFERIVTALDDCERPAQNAFFAHHEEEFNLHIGYELVRDLSREDAFLA